MRNNFLGSDKFIWWVGEVAARNDPLGIGRCRVRIFGWHTDNVSLLPEDELPWAHPLLPLNNAQQFSTPKPGDWVVGFFMDGDAGQFPVMMGVLPAIKT